MNLQPRLIGEKKKMHTFGYGKLAPGTDSKGKLRQDADFQRERERKYGLEQSLFAEISAKKRFCRRFLSP